MEPGKMLEQIEFKSIIEPLCNDLQVKVLNDAEQNILGE